jgi:apolipoprotein N-acyltransferase
LGTALAGSAFLYLDRWGFSSPWIETPLALLFFLLLLRGDRRRWLWTGFFLGLCWFWWIGMSFLHYGHPWAVPLVSFAVALVYALLFWAVALLAESLATLLSRHSPFSVLRSQLDPGIKALALLFLSRVHPFGFDWFKPELVLVHTVFGVDKGSFALILAALWIFLFGGPKRRSYGSVLGGSAALLLLLPALDLHQARVLPDDPTGRVAIRGTETPVERKWRREYLDEQIRNVLSSIDRAIAEKHRAILLPESVLPLFLNRQPGILSALRRRSRKIDIVLGALYLTPDRQNRNAAYLFRDGNYTVANKVVLVPFGEANPLPGWASRWVNELFFDGAPDYQAAETPTDFLLNGRKYRPAVCYEGTSERLYADRPRRLLMLSNNGWFHPSVEPTLQRLLLEYYHRKYGTEIWHAVNMGPSYFIGTDK